MPESEPLAWYTPDTARTAFNITVTQQGLDIAREECLTRKGLAASTPTPPSASFAAGVVYQALANKQATQAYTDDDTGGENSVRLYPFDRKIMAMLVIPDVDPDDATRDRSYVRSLIG